MRNSRAIFWFRSVLAATAVLLGLLTISSTASAFGTFRLKQTTVEEADGRWKFNVEVDYGSKPHLGHIPFDFIFVQKVYYEYSITDSDPKPVQRRKPMQNQPPQREQMDIGFADARGDLWQRTKFSFSVRRDRGFSAGEYTLTVKRSSDGAIMGQPMNIVLGGQNELIDRRSIVFAGEKKPDKKKPAEDKPKADAESSEPASAAGSSDGAEGPDEPETPAEPMDTSFADSPPPVEPKRGCGCRAVGGPTSAVAPLMVLLLLSVFGLRRRS